MLENLPILPEDPTGKVYQALAADANPRKVDLGIGVYRDASGNSPVMAAVREAQARVVARQESKAYLPPRGNAHYLALMERLVLGADHEALRDRRIFSTQTPGAGGGLRCAAEFIKQASPGARIWVPRPTWDHQLLIFEYAGLTIFEHGYYDPQDHRLRFDTMMDDLKQARPGDVLLLHGCCHNPTGADLSLDQWSAIAHMAVARGIVPFVDLVYQGLGEGLEGDVEGLRLLARSVPEMLLVSSSSKSFATYRDRAGLFSVMAAPGAAGLANASRHISRITRSLYFMPPDMGAATVVELLADPALSMLWETELEFMRNRIAGQRVTMRRALETRLARSFAHLTEERGMFSLLGLPADEVARLAQEHGIYLMPDSRINFAAIADRDVERVADAIAAVMTVQVG